MADCLFCRIAAKQIPATLAAETEDLVAFHDVKPQAPVHVLVIPRRHIGSLNELGAGDEGLVGRMFGLAKDLAGKLGIAERGWRTVFNVGADGGQTVFHLHLHVLGGRPMSWPPG